MRERHRRMRTFDVKLLHVTLKRNLAVPSGQKKVLAAADYRRHAGLRCLDVVRRRLGPRAFYLHTILEAVAINSFRPGRIRNPTVRRFLHDLGVRRQSEAATALWK